MNLAKLFEVQKVLRDRIGYNEPDRFDKLVLALLVEVGECANEWRGFKFWSKDQEPRTKEVLKGTDGKVNAVLSDKNPLLEEYVDGLHFVLDLGIDLGYVKGLVYPVYTNTIVRQFIEVFARVSALQESVSYGDSTKHPDRCYESLLGAYIHLGRMLGFTWEQIEQAYMDKNKVNHQRQDEGY
jgi:dimeric dUTPase (all-alpha-NTP-PPase superfamily)